MGLFSGADAAAAARSSAALWPIRWLRTLVEEASRGEVSLQPEAELALLPGVMWPSEAAGVVLALGLDNALCWCSSLKALDRDPDRSSPEDLAPSERNVLTPESDSRSRWPPEHLDETPSEEMTLEGVAISQSILSSSRCLEVLLVAVAGGRSDEARVLHSDDDLAFALEVDAEGGVLQLFELWFDPTDWLLFVLSELALAVVPQLEAGRLTFPDREESTLAIPRANWDLEQIAALALAPSEVVAGLALLNLVVVTGEAGASSSKSYKEMSRLSLHKAFPFGDCDKVTRKLFFSDSPISASDLEVSVFLGSSVAASLRCGLTMAKGFWLPRGEVSSVGALSRMFELKGAGCCSWSSEKRGETRFLDDELGEELEVFSFGLIFLVRGLANLNFCRSSLVTDFFSPSSFGLGVDSLSVSDSSKEELLVSLLLWSARDEKETNVRKHYSRSHICMEVLSKLNSGDQSYYPIKKSCHKNFYELLTAALVHYSKRKVHPP